MRALGADDGDDSYRAWFAPFTADERAALLGRRSLHGQQDVVALARGDRLRRMLFVDSHSWLSDNLLERSDRMSMAASLELRPPFLDHRLAELAFALPSRMKVRRGKGKWIVREVARRYLPDEIINRKKVGFRVPLDAWFRGGLREFAWDLLTRPNSYVGEVTDRRLVRQLLERHENDLVNEEKRIWTLLGLEIWHEVFFRASTS